MSESKIECPNCGHSFDVEAVLATKAERRIRKEMESDYAARMKDLDSLRKALKDQQEEFETKKQKENEIFSKKLEERIEKERKEFQEKARKSLKEEYKLQLDAFKKEIDERKEENKALKQQEIEFLKRENSLKEQAEKQEMALQKQFLEQQRAIEEKAREKEREAMALKEKDYQKQLEDQRKLIDEMKRKSEQGSMQLQGEVQELALEELLAHAYPYDSIDEVPKGIRGADCIQTVMNGRQQACGSIVYESKRTKAFAKDWIDKLKQDQVDCKADLAVIVTESFPADMSRFGERDGVWICGFHEVKSLSFVLREMLLRTHAVRTADENKGDKKEMLYTYLTSNEFIQNIQRIVENYDGMTQQLSREKRAMQKLWKEREKQIWVVQENIASLFGSIKGIAGRELDTYDVLELPESEE